MTAPVRVVMTCRYPPTQSGGVESVVRELTSVLPDLRPDWQIEVCTAFSRRSGLAKIPLLGDLVAASRIGRELAHLDWDVAVVHGAEYVWAARLAARARRLPVIAVWHGLRSEELRRYVGIGFPRQFAGRAFQPAARLLEDLAAHAPFHVSVNPDVGRRLGDRYGNLVIVVAPNGVRSHSGDTPEPTQPRRRDRRLELCWIASGSPYGKGLDVCSRASRRTGRWADCGRSASTSAFSVETQRCPVLGSLGRSSHARSSSSSPPIFGWPPLPVTVRGVPSHATRGARRGNAGHLRTRGLRMACRRRGHPRRRA
jgi:glycosyltransferase involved in cell wall biosynthesis